MKFLKTNGYINIKKNSSFILAEGTLPICLIAHIDTVFNHTQKEENFIYDKNKNILWGVGGSGFDDRAGITAIIELVRRGYRPHILFTDGEEIGGLGATELVTRYSKWPFPTPCHALVELDRANRKDAVYYSCNNPDFQNYIESFDFEYNYGSFTDISIIMPVWKIAGVNLSVGYEREHSPNEWLHVDWLYETIDKVEKILLMAPQMNHYKYIAKHYSTIPWNNAIWNNHCIICGTPLDNQNSVDIFEDIEPYRVCTTCYKNYYL